MRQEQDRRGARLSVMGTLLVSVLFFGATPRTHRWPTRR